MIKDQNILAIDEHLQKFLIILDEEVRKSFEEVMLQYQTSEERWNAFLSHHDLLFQRQQLPKSMKHIREEIKLQYTYPRLDINVTKGLNHLLKAPFSMHPKTGKISIPFNPKLVDKFDPVSAPNINMIVDEINIFDAKTKEQEKMIDDKKLEEGTVNTKRIKDYKKTSLLKPINTFEEFLRGIEKSKNIKKKAENMEF